MCQSFVFERFPHHTTKRRQQTRVRFVFVMSGATPPSSTNVPAEEVPELAAESLRAAGLVLPEEHRGDEPSAPHVRGPPPQSQQSRASSAPDAFPTAAAAPRTFLPAQSQRQRRDENPFQMRDAPAYVTPSPEPRTYTHQDSRNGVEYPQFHMGRSPEKHCINSEESQAREGRMSFLERAVAQINQQLGNLESAIHQQIFPWLHGLQLQSDQEISTRTDATADLGMHVDTEVARPEGTGDGRGGGGIHDRQKQPMISRRGFDSVTELFCEIRVSTTGHSSSRRLQGSRLGSRTISYILKTCASPQPS